MDSTPIQGSNGSGQERLSLLLAMDYQRLHAARARQVEAGPEARGTSTDPDGSQQGLAYDFQLDGQHGRVVMKAGSRPGIVHVSIRWGAPRRGERDEQTPRLTLEADVSSQWLQSVTRGASTQSEQAIRIATALRDANRDADKPGPLTVEPTVIRGPVRPQWPAVWLPAEYPPPPDDPSLQAQVVAGAGSEPPETSSNRQ